MSRRDLKQKGFGTLELIMLIVAIGLIAGIAVYVYRYSSENTSTNNSTSQTTSTKRGVLTIKEWGVTMAQPSLTTGLTYVMQNPDKDGVERLMFTYKGLPEIDDKCDATLADIGTLARFTPSSTITLSTSGQTETVAEIEKDSSASAVLKRYTKTGDNYYYLTSDFKPICGGTEAKNFLNSKVYTTGFKSLSDPSIQNSIRLRSAPI